MTEKLMSPKITDPKPSAKITKTDAEWKQQLTPEQYQVARACGTEPAFTGQYWNKHDDGTYHCVCCGKLFCRRRPCQHRRTHRHQLRHETNRGALCRLRCASGPRVSGWSGPDRPALLHELSVPGLQAEEVIKEEVINRTEVVWRGHSCPRACSLSKRRAK